MRRLLKMTAAALLLAAPMAACNTIPTTGPFESTLVDEKGLYAAEAAYFGVGTAIEAAVDAGLLTGDRARQVAALDDSAHTALVAARTAHRLGNTADLQTQAALVLGAAADIQRILRPQPG